MFSKLLNTRFWVFNVVLILLVFLGTPIQAQQDNDTADPYEKFGKYTEGSDLVIHHMVWSAMLYDSVVVITPSTRRMASTKNSASTGTKIRRGSRSAARFESNRVQFHLLDDEFKILISKYRQELEELPTHFPLHFFNKDEQLAFWLNLHNAILYEQLVKRYPVSKLKKLRNGGGKKGSLWNEKLITVEGVPLSLNDIQNNILIRHWKSPMVLYGLYQGAIGGPNLPNRAFNGKNVHILLERNAKEFINSNRGIKAWGDKTQVSLIYEWGNTAFPDWERDLGRHLIQYADASKAPSVSQSTAFTAKLYDWSIADTKGGNLSAGPKHSTAANLLTMGRNDDATNSLQQRAEPGIPAQVTLPGAVNTNLNPQVTGLQSSRGGSSQMLNNLYRDGMVIPGAYDSNMIDLLRALKQKLKVPPEGIVTSIECGPEDTTCVEPVPEGNENKPAD